MYVEGLPFKSKMATTISLTRRGGVVVKRPPRMREIRVRSPVGTDLSR